MIKVTLTTLLEKAINSFLALDANQKSRLESHHGKALNLKFTDISFDIYLIIHIEKIHVHSTHDENVDTVIAGSLLSFLKQLKSKATSDDIKIEGDVEFAHDLLRLLKNIDVNWEEYAAFFVGDMAAFHIGNFLQQFTRSVKQISARTIEDALDYIQEEKKFIPTKEEVEDFYDDLQELRNDIDRLEARWNRLMEKSTHETI